jgi:hypothetical protein
MQGYAVRHSRCSPTLSAGDHHVHTWRGRLARVHPDTWGRGGSLRGGLLQVWVSAALAGSTLLPAGGTCSQPGQAGW